MEKRGMNAWLWIGLIGVLTTGPMLFTDLYRAFWENRDIWWTPPRMALSLEDTRDRFQVAIGGKPLEKHLSEGTLLAVDPNGTRYRVVSQDVKVRINNWDRMHVSLWMAATASGLGFGVSLALLIVGWSQRLRGKKAQRGGLGNSIS